MRLHRFEPYGDEAAFDFPAYDIQAQLGNATAGSDFTLTTGSAFDPHGSGNAPQDPYTIGVSFEQLVGNRAEDLRPLIDSTRGLLGKWGKLYVRPYGWVEPVAKVRIGPDTAERWIEARCIQTGQDRTLRNYLYQPFDLVFEVETGPWRGLPYGIWRFDGFVSELDGFQQQSNWRPDGRWPRRRWDIGGFTGSMRGSPFRYERSNGQPLAFTRGNADVTDPVITVIPEAQAVTYVEIEGERAHLIFEDGIAPGSALTIDCGSYSVTNGGLNAFNDFRLGPNHRLRNWLTLKPGGNPITVTYRGGEPLVIFDISWIDAWA